MKNIVLAAVILLYAACKKDTPSTPPPPPAVVPTVSTVSVSGTTRTTATAGGIVSKNGGAPITGRGVCYSTSSNPTIASSVISNGTDTGTFVCNITNLTVNTQYYIRAYATNSVGTAYGNEISFTTKAISAPLVNTTATVTTITPFATTASGDISDDGGHPVTAKGVCWSSATTPTIADSKTNEGSGTATFTSSIPNLLGNTTYYIRAYATNVLGTNYGQLVTVTTDIEGNVYNTVKIGTQTWTVENLKVTKLNTGVNIIHGVTNSVWVNGAIPPTPLYCWYNNDITYKNIYGALYNWPAVNTGVLSPIGWHIPSNEEFRILTHFLDPSTVDTIHTLFGNPFLFFRSTITAGKKLQEQGSAHWQSSVAYGTNESGFTALPGGWRNEMAADFTGLNSGGIWWSSTNVQANNSNCFRLLGGGVDNWPDGIRQGFSVRCIKN